MAGFQLVRLILLELALERLDFFGQRLVAANEVVDLADGMQHSGMVAATKAPPDLGHYRGGPMTFTDSATRLHVPNAAAAVGAEITWTKRRS